MRHSSSRLQLLQLSSAWGVLPAVQTLKAEAAGAGRHGLIYYGSSGIRRIAFTRTRDRPSTRCRQGIVAPRSRSLHGWRRCCHLGLVGWDGRYHSKAELKAGLHKLTVFELVGSDPAPETTTRNISVPKSQSSSEAASGRRHGDLGVMGPSSASGAINECHLSLGPRSYGSSSPSHAHWPSEVALAALASP